MLKAVSAIASSLFGVRASRVKLPRHARNKYTPHIGAKEQERAKRCYMSSTFNASGNERSAPVMHQIAKRG